MSANDEFAGRMDVDEFRRAALRFLGAPGAGFAVELTAAAPIIPTPTISMTIDSAPPRPAGIPWVPIADMPEAWKDGREVLLWCRNTEAMHVAWWEVRFMWAGWVRWGDDRPFFNPTHVAAINPPEGL